MLDECHVDSALGLFRFSEALAWTTIFPYVFFMMQSFLSDGPKRDAQAAAYASLTVALFTFGEFLMGIAWAKVSDRLGRKPTLIIGVVGGSVSALAFDLSTNLWMALSARLFGGLVNPNVSVVSACVGELVKRKEHYGSCRVLGIGPGTSLANTVKCSRQGLFGCSVLERAWVSPKNSRSMKLNLMFTFRSLIGPVIGGHLADPVNNLPSIFRKGTLWETFPYLLSNLIVALIIMISGFLGFFFLKESHPQKQDQTDMGLKISSWISKKTRSLFGKLDIREYTVLAAEDDAIPLASNYQIADEESSKDSDDLDTTTPELSTSPDSARPKASAYTRKVILQIVVVSLLAFHKVSSDVIIPTFLAASSTGHSEDDTDVTFFRFKIGFGMASPSIANVLLTQAVVAILSQIFIVPRVIDRFEPLKTIRWALSVFPWLYCITPFTARLPYPLSIIAILLDLWTKGILVSLGYVASAIL